METKQYTVFTERVITLMQTPKQTGLQNQNRFIFLGCNLWSI